MCFTSSCSSSSICWALVRRVSFFSFSSCWCSVRGILLLLPLSISTIFCFLAFAAANYWSFCSSNSFRYYDSCSFVWILVAAFILSSSFFEMMMASDFCPFSVFSRMSFNSSLATTTTVFSAWPAPFFPFWFPIHAVTYCHLKLAIR